MKTLKKTMPAYIAAALLTFVFLFVPLALAAGKGSWSVKKPASTERTEMAAVSAGGKVYVIGGFRRLGVTDRVEGYDSWSDTWEQRTSLPESLHHVGAAAVGDRVYVIGGFKGAWPWNPVDTVYEYDPAKDAWLRKASMPTARHGLGVAAMEGRIYVVSGGPKPGGSMSSVNEVFTPAR
jgi:N-acetylneuraminic acid mutarotase